MLFEENFSVNKKNYTKLIVGMVSAVSFSTLDTVNAATVSVQLPYEDFGHVENSGSLCAPTATINSFKFLENTYPEIYGNSLTGNDIVAARNELATYMGSCPVNGTSAQEMWEGKINYIEDKAPGSTIFGGMVNPNYDISTWIEKELLESAYPTFDWLFKQLVDGEDVEIGILGGLGGHALTLTSLSFEDNNNNNQWNPNLGETAKIDYLDPNNPTQLFMSDLSLNGTNNYLEFEWNNGGINTNENVYISLAFKESPKTPESSTLFGLMFIGCIGIRSVLNKKQS